MKSLKYLMLLKNLLKINKRKKLYILINIIKIDFSPSQGLCIKNMNKCYFWQIKFQYDESRKYTIKIILINFTKYDRNKIKKYLQKWK